MPLLALLAALQSFNSPALLCGTARRCAACEASAVSFVNPLDIDGFVEPGHPAAHQFLLMGLVGRHDPRGHGGIAEEQGLALHRELLGTGIIPAFPVERGGVPLAERATQEEVDVAAHRSFPGTQSTSPPVSRLAVRAITKSKSDRRLA